MMEFTKSELYEIERAFDERAALIVEGVKQNENLPRGLRYRVNDECLDSYGVFRTISAKAAFFRDGIPMRKQSSVETHTDAERMLAVIAFYLVIALFIAVLGWFFMRGLL